MREERQPCVYLLTNRFNGTLYIGVTRDLPRRFHEHRTGTVPGFASRDGVTRLVYFEMHETMPLAIAREKALQNWHRERKCNLTERVNPRWDDLAIGLGLAPPGGC